MGNLVTYIKSRLNYTTKPGADTANMFLTSKSGLNIQGEETAIVEPK